MFLDGSALVFVGQSQSKRAYMTVTLNCHARVKLANNSTWSTSSDPNTGDAIQKNVYSIHRHCNVC
jgi:hypothetical protein